MTKHLETGKHGEKLAVDYLTKKGYEILGCNFRYKRSEIDIIAQKDTLLVFIEVKTRSGNYYGNPEDAINDKKKNALLAAAEYYIYKNDWQGDIRFDALSILKNKETKITHFKDIFS